MYDIDSEIESMIQRAGHPIFIAKGDRQDPPTEAQKTADQINRLMIALEDVTLERDQLINDLIEANEDAHVSLCNYCTHFYDDGSECEPCALCDEPIAFEYRGVPESDTLN